MSNPGLNSLRVRLLFRLLGTENVGFRRSFEHWGFIIFYKGESSTTKRFQCVRKYFYVVMVFFFNYFFKVSFIIELGKRSLLNSSSWVLSFMFHFQGGDDRKVLLLNMSGLMFIRSDIFIYFIDGKRYVVAAESV